MAGLRELPNLVRLGLAGCGGVGNGALGSVAALPALQELNLEWCSVGDKGASPLHLPFCAFTIASCVAEDDGAGCIYCEDARHQQGCQGLEGLHKWQADCCIPAKDLGTYHAWNIRCSAYTLAVRNEAWVRRVAYRHQLATSPGAHRLLSKESHWWCCRAVPPQHADQPAPPQRRLLGRRRRRAGSPVRPHHPDRSKSGLLPRHRQV